MYGTSRHATNGEEQDGFRTLQLDVTSESSIQKALAYVQEHEGKLDVLINNAGLGMAGPIENTTTEEAKNIFNTNVFGVLNMCRLAVPMLRQSQSPYLINVTSIAGKLALPFRGIYAASKHAVEGMTESLSMELHPFGIRVCIIEPGDFNTDINQRRIIASHVDKSLYNGAFDQTLAQINKEVSQAPAPHAIAKTVERILKTSSPRLRYVVGSPIQRLSIHIKKLLPGRRFESMLMKHYRLK